MNILEQKLPISTRTSCKALLLCVLVLFFISASCFAQETAGNKAPPLNKNVFQIEARAIEGNKIRSGEKTVILWGTSAIETPSAQFHLKARTDLDNLIGSKSIECEKKGLLSAAIIAQCQNSKGIDMGLYMIQKGYVSVDRSVVYDTVFEDPYINAESDAQAKGEGIWSLSESDRYGKYEGTPKMVALSLAILILAAGIFVVLAIMLLRGLRQSIAAQDRSANLILKERELREKEKKIVASMLNAELNANKSKIEAYLVIYDEMHKALKDPGISPQYKETGDMVQMQPALDRAVFEGNTDKMDLLGRDLASDVIHFYARIKTHPDYTNLEPQMPLNEAIELVQKAVENAKRLDQILGEILQSFSDKNLG